MKLVNKFAIIAAGIAVSFGVIQGQAQAASFNQIVDIDAKQNTTSNPFELMLSAGTYSVTQIGTADGGAYDAWNAWGANRVSGCDDNGAGCRNGWLNSYAISSNDFDQTASNKNRYDSPLTALQNAVDSTFTLTSDTLVDFSIKDSAYGDNVGGVSLRVASVASQAVPEPASMLGLLAVGSIGVSSLKRKKKAV